MGKHEILQDLEKLKSQEKELRNKKSEVDVTLKMKKRLLEKNNKINKTIQRAEKEISEAKHTIEQNKADISSLEEQENESS